MRAFQIEERFGLEQLRLHTRPTPQPAPGQVLVRMRAVSLNYRDLMMVRGEYNPRQPLPLIPCSDGVGEVVARGDGVEDVALGARVATLFAQGWIAGAPSSNRIRHTLGGPLDGTLTEAMVLPADGVIAIPEHLSDEEGATLPCAALTAWSALVTQGDVGPGDVVLILGTGGVATFALQFALTLGARVIVTSSSDDKLARALALGAEAGVNYRDEPRWGRRVRELAGGDGVDHVIEVGGASTLAQSLQAVRPGGHISLIGVLSGAVKDLNIVPVLMRNIRIQGVFVGHRDGFEAMSRAITQHAIRPVIDRVYPFEQAPDAFARLASGRHLGKICVRVDEAHVDDPAAQPGSRS